MNHADFVHLHNHSDYSLLDGASPIPRMVERAAEMRMPALALTDHGSLFGAVEFYQEARRAGVKPIVGMEAYVTRGDRKDRTRDTAHHLVLLARDEQGFKNLMKLSSFAFLEGFYYKPRVDHGLLAQYSAGLLALSACPKGEVASDLLEDNEERAAQTALMYRDMFGAENYFLEVQNHGIDIEDKIRERVAALARRTGIPRVATNDCHYLRHEDWDAHDVLLCIQTGKTVDDTKRMQMNTTQLFFRSPEEMKAAFAGDDEVIRNTLAVAERCNLQLNFGRPLLPAFPLPAGAGSAEDYLCSLARAELEKRCPGAGPDMRQRLDYELGVICRMGFASYFLIVRDFIAYARSQGIGVGPGRGSVAGSLVAYVLRITDIDPLQHGLIFERFLNPERVSMPDIDIDFDDLRRGEVIEYVKRKYGEGNVTQIITFGTMGAKGVVRDVGRALGMAFAEVDRIAKLVPDGLGMTLERALELSPDLKALPQRGPGHARLLKSARVLEGLARHASTHAAGVLITPGPLLDYVPLYRQKDESITTQWDMKAVEKAGLLKMDFLGLRTLSVLQGAAALVAEGGGPTLDLLQLPLDDAAAYEVFQRADTVGIFQFESSGMREYLRSLKPTVFGDLVAMNALYRPGPMEHIPFFIECKHGRQVARYEHPGLEPILNGTYGVFVYQEQVMQAANALAGFSMAQADELRRAMGKKKPEEMEAKRAQFIEGCRKNKIAPVKAEKIFATMEKFAGYGFNRCMAPNTVIEDADSGRRWTIGEMFRKRPTMRVHALGDDWKLHRRRVKDIVWNGVREIFEVRTVLGKRLRVTANHPLRTLDGWVCVSDLRPGDRIAAPRRMESGARRRWPRHELITLAGLISEGNTCHPTTLHFYCNERPLVEDFALAIGRFDDTIARIWSRGDGRLEVHANLGRHYRVREGDEVVYQVEGNLALVCDAEGRRSGAFRWAERLGILGKKATQKRVPPEVFELAQDDVRLFLGRLWSGDGFLANDRNNPPFYATSSKGLADDVQALLLRLGIVSRIKCKNFKYRGGHKPGYTVELVGENVRSAFLRELGPHILGRDTALRLLRKQVAACAPDRSSKDTVPLGVVDRIDAERTRLNWTKYELQQRAGVDALATRKVRVSAGLRRSTLARVGSALGCRELQRLATSDVYWDRVVSIEPAGVEDVYDIEIEGDHNFVADGLIVHNSHSAAYALLAYQTAYLKAHHPAEFMAATLTSEMADSARIVTLIEECRRMKLEILPPDVNRSAWRFTLENGKVRFGLGAVRNVGQASVEAIVAARKEGGAFRDLFDLAMRVDARAMNRRVLESLVAAGACDGLGPERGAMHAGAEKVLQQAAALQRERTSGQSSLFGEETGGGVAVVAPPLPEGPPWSGGDRSAKEKEVLGFYFSEHPLEPLREMLAKLVTHNIGDALTLEDGAEVRVGAVVMEVKKITTRAGKAMAAVMLEDLTGRIECTVFPEGWEAARTLLEEDRIVVVSGRIEVREERGTKLMLAEARSLEQARSEYRPCLHLEIRSENLSVGWLEQVDETLSGFPGDSDVYLHIVLPDHSRKASRSKRYRVAEDERVVAAIKQRFPFVRVAWGKGMA